MREEAPQDLIYHPWQDLRERWRHVVVDHTDDLPAGLLADTNGVDHVRMRRRLLQVERRCALAHEIIHLEHGDTTECRPAIEHDVNREASRRLISWKALVRAVRWARSESELAAELWVTPQILRARTEALTADEMFELARAAQDAHHMMPIEREQ